jgi:hypothetical protein
MPDCPPTAHATIGWFALAAVFAASIATPAAAETVIAFWDFNDGFNEPNETVQIVHSATIGSGTIYQQRAEIDSNGKDGVAFTDATLGINVTDGQAFAWNDIANSGDNDAEFFAEFSTLGFTNIRFRFDVRGNGDGANEIVSYDLKYALDPLEDVVNPGDVIGTVKDFAGGVSTSIFNNRSLPANGSTFITESVDLGGIAAINNQSNVALSLDDFKENNAMRIDNFLVTGITAIPEPSSVAALLATAGVVLVRRRRR